MRRPRRITAVYLQRVTGHYLERYSTTRVHLRRLLMRRVRRAVECHADLDFDACAALVDGELDRLERLGLLDDERFATDRARRMHRRGASTRQICAALTGKGVSAQDIDTALSTLAESTEDPDLEAALAYARKRRLGAWRRVPLDRDRREKELRRLARAGFSFDVARKVVD